MAVSFVPLIMETLGGCSKQTLSSIGYFVGHRLGIPPLSPLATSFRNVPSPYGEAMLLSGFAAAFHNSQEKMASYDF